MKTKEFYFLTWAAFLVAFSFTIIAIWNTEWMLVEKGYYWLGIIFITYSSFALSKEIRDRQEAKALDTPEDFSEKE